MKLCNLNSAPPAQHPHLDILRYSTNSTVAIASPPSTASANTTASSTTTTTTTNAAISAEHSFRVKHFAGSVTYDARDFVERNVDALDRDLSRAMFDCRHPLLKVKTYLNTSSVVFWSASRKGYTD